MQTQPPGKLYHDKEEFGDWGWIRAEGSPALVAVVKWPGPTEEECERHRSAGTDPHQPMVNRIIQCYNACAGITDPAAHITGLENQLEAWETSAKLRDDGECPTQRDVIADQQAQIEALREALDHPLIRQLMGEIEDNQSPEGTRLWGIVQSWQEIREQALKAEGREA